MNQAAGTLFPIERAPRVRPVSRPRSRCGRGAVPVRRVARKLDGRNPTGRRVLTFRYRPRKAWRPDLLAAACELLTEYFRQLGGFRVADDATVRAWYDALAGGLFTAAELRWAIEAKAASLAADTSERGRDLRRFVTSPARFLNSAGYWLTQSPAYRFRLGLQERRAAQRLRADLSALCGSRPVPGALPGVAGAASGGGAMRAACVGAVGRLDLAAAVRAAEARYAALWNALGAERQALALAAVRPILAARCRQWGAAPDAPELSAVAVAMALNWALKKWPEAAHLEPLPATLFASVGP